MHWATDGATWPLSAHSRFVLCKPHKWHLQDVGTGPLLVLLHGAGGATHSWRHLIPLLAQDHRVIAIDLPGQGFTQLGAQHRCGLDDMAQDLLALLDAENLTPHAIIGHSAGGAIALRMAELMQPAAPFVIGINAALAPFDGVAGVVFPILAKTIAALPLAAEFVSATSARGGSVDRILKSTGSTLPPEDIDLYRRLVASPGHVNATLKMMAQWQLDGLLDRLPDNPAKTLLIAADGDKTVLPHTSRNAAAQMPNASCITLPDLGHLAHEEDAQSVADLIHTALEAA